MSIKIKHDGEIYFRVDASPLNSDCSSLYTVQLNHRAIKVRYFETQT